MIWEAWHIQEDKYKSNANNSIIWPLFLTLSSIQVYLTLQGSKQASAARAVSGQSQIRMHWFGMALNHCVCCILGWFRQNTWKWIYALRFKIPWIQFELVLALQNGISKPLVRSIMINRPCYWAISCQISPWSKQRLICLRYLPR